jgi:alkylation response protein AidB-like acyl-CoA dehydrogenase
VFYYDRVDFTPTQRQLAAAEAYHDAKGLPLLPVPEELGGSGLSVTELAAVLHEAGRHADGSVLTLMTGTLPLVRWGDRELVTKRPRVTAALRGQVRLAGNAPTPAGARVTPAGARVTEAAADSTVSGVVPAVPYCAESDYVLVAAGDAVAIVATASPGATIVATRTSSGEPEATLRLDSTPAHALFTGRATDLARLTTLAACCLADGALAAALELTAEHVAKRHQFGKPLATFQAVAQRIADIAIASRTVHLVTLSAAWQLERGTGHTDIELAGYWIAETAARSVMDCHHLHGGIGMDTTYPLHRFSSLIADQVRRLGGAEYRLERLACTSI